MSEFSPADIHALDQAAVEAFADADDLANDPETARRLAEHGPAVYAAQLTVDLAHAVQDRPLALAGFAAMATIRRVQEREERNELRAEIQRLRAAGRPYCDFGYPLGGAKPRVNWCGLERDHAGMHVGGAVGVSFGNVGTVRRGGVS